MNFNFELILFYIIVISGLITLFDILFLATKRQKAYAKKTKHTLHPPEMKLPLIVDYARSFFPVLLIVFVLRSFLFEPFRIPSGSLEPTLQIGDFILVNKFDYGIRIPVIHKKVISHNEPQRGDIIVFRWPPNPSVNFIKRIIGVPGDHISYINKELTVNGQKIPQQMVGLAISQDESGGLQNVIEKRENFFGIDHSIYQNEGDAGHDFHDIVVPEGMYFAMGDNRDNSADSRFWGFIPEQNIVGKAVLVWMSWDSSHHKVRWKRISGMIH